MAERVVSPGVFTNEIDLSFLPAAVSDIGAALIGISSKGPAFVPTVVDSFSDFKVKFGGMNPDYYLPYAAKSYLKSSGTCTIVRVLGTTGYTATSAVTINAGTATAATATLTVDDGDEAASGQFTEGEYVVMTATDGTVGVYVLSDLSETGASADGTVLTEGSDIGVGTLPAGTAALGTCIAVGVNLNTNSQATVLNAIKDALQSTNSPLKDKITGTTAGTSTGNQSSTFTQATSGTDGNTVTTTNISQLTAGDFSGGTDSVTVAAVFPSASDGTLASTTIVGKAEAGSFNLNWWGTSVSPTMSLNASDGNYIVDVLGTGVIKRAESSKYHPGYVAQIFREKANSQATATAVSIDLANNAFTNGYSEGETPYILSQTGSTSSDTTSLFKFQTLSHGESANRELKVAISNIKKAGTIAGSDYGTFDVLVRSYDDKDKRPNVLESYTGVNLDPDSTNYIARRIGDIRWQFNTTKLKTEVLSGDYENKSKYIRVTDIYEGVKNGTASPNLIPWGFGSYSYPVNAGLGGLAVSIPMRMNQTESAEYNSKLYHGLAFDSGSTSLTGYAQDIKPYLSPKPATTQTDMTSSEFRLDLVGVNPDATLGTKKFILGFHKGDDGFDPTYKGGPSSDGKYHGLGHANPSDSGNDLTPFKNAINTISNADEVDINMLVLPGINKKTHPKVHVKARDVVEDRADAFYVFDAGDWDSNIAGWHGQISTEDTNYASTYYPWVKILDDENNKHVWVPPSVVLPGVISFTDKVAHPWFAPAGLNRGGLTDVLMAKERLTHAERDTLYENRVNPIATFPGEGVVVWGQKTLQAKPSALDRVNVRRLLIKIRKFIASSSRFLVFEQNTNATRQRFLNIVNPYLETVQSNSGVSAFRVVMDDSNNTPDVVDRNELRGQIFVQPTRTAEFIILDFIVQPTGATFED
tara:strand:+ start:4836 stop:7610 length:2775 start_codon:yes stop_codon:yes gene_type:complete